MMDVASLLTGMNVALVAGGAAIGLGIGFLAGRSSSPAVAVAERLRAELDRAAVEHETYKTSVNAHFRKTADLVGDMTRSYAAVYDHLAVGARRFCEDTGPDTSIAFSPLPDALASPVIETAAEEAGVQPAAAPVMGATSGDDVDHQAMEFGVEASSDSEAVDIGLEATMQAAEDYADAADSAATTSDVEALSTPAGDAGAAAPKVSH